MSVTVRRCREEDIEAWAELREALWPDGSFEEHRREIVALLKDAEVLALLACDGALAVGFAEAALRRDYVNGCDTSPVPFVEGLYVRPEWRRRGIARGLVGAVEDWARGLGLAELASDVLLDNLASQQAHEALGFEERERVVFYRKRLRRG